MSLHLVVSKGCLYFEGSVMVGSSHLGPETLSSMSFFNDSLEFGDLDSILVLHAGEFSQMSVFEDRMSLTKEVINQECELVARSHIAGPLPELVYKSIDAGWHRVICQVALVLVMELTVEEDTTLAWTSQRISLLLRRVLLTEQLRRVFTQPHKARSIHLPRNSIGPHRFFSSDILS